MKELITNPVWRRPAAWICPVALLPAFVTAKELWAWHQANGPSCKVKRVWQCDDCGCWHMATSAPGRASKS